LIETAEPLDGLRVSGSVKDRLFVDLEKGF